MTDSSSCESELNRVETLDTVGAFLVASSFGKQLHPVVALSLADRNFFHGACEQLRCDFIVPAARLEKEIPFEYSTPLAYSRGGRSSPTVHTTIYCYSRADKRDGRWVPVFDREARGGVG